MLRRRGRRGRLDTFSPHRLLSLGPCVHLSVRGQTLGTGLDCDGLTVFVFAAGLPIPRHRLLLFFPGEESMRVPLHVGGVQQLFWGIDHGDAASPRADPAAPVAVLSGGPRCLGDGDVREGQLEGILPRRAPDGRGRRQPVVFIRTSTVFIIRPFSGCLKLTQLRFLISAWMETKNEMTCGLPRGRVCELNDFALKRQMKQLEDSKEFWEKKRLTEILFDTQKKKLHCSLFRGAGTPSSTLQKEAFKGQKAVLLYRRCREALSLEWTPQSHIPLKKTTFESKGNGMS